MGSNRTLSQDLRVALLIAALATLTYSLLLSVNWDANSLSTAQGVEAGAVVHVNHMLFEMSGYLAWRLAESFGYTGRAYPLLEILAAFFGGITLGATYVAAREIGATRLASTAMTLWLGTTWAFWTWSTNGAYIIAAAMCSAIAVALQWNATTTRQEIAVGVLAALGIVAWQGNVSLIPALMAGVLVQTASHQARSKRLLTLLLSFGVTLTVVYLPSALFKGVTDIDGFLKWATSYGGARLDSWGHWGSDRVGSLAESWIHSAIGWIPLKPEWFLNRPIRFDTVFPRLAPWALMVLIAIPLALFLRRPKDRAALWCLIGIVCYVPFLVWWDPYETKWLLPANVFIALFAARLWSVGGSTRYSWAPVLAAVLLCISQVARYGMPAHTRLSAENRVGDCVGQHLGSKDLFIAADWAFGGYMGYRYKLRVIDLIGAVVDSGYDKSAAFNEVLAQAKAHEALGGSTYMTEISFYSPERLQFLADTAHLTRADMEAFRGQVVFDCQGWPIMKLDLRR